MAKKIVICDTDVIIDYWDTKQKRHSITLEIIEQKIGIENVAISAVTKMELLKGATNKQDLTKTLKGLKVFNVVLINDDITLKAFEFLETFSLSHNLSIPDCLIAATAITTELDLFTYNTKDYTFIPGIALYKI